MTWQEKSGTLVWFLTHKNMQYIAMMGELWVAKWNDFEKNNCVTITNTYFIIELK